MHQSFQRSPVADMQTMHVRTCPTARRAHTAQAGACQSANKPTLLRALAANSCSEPQQTRPLMMTKVQVKRAVPAGACSTSTGIVHNSNQRPLSAVMPCFGVRRGRNGPLWQAPMLPLGVWVAAGQASTSHSDQFGSRCLPASGRAGPRKRRHGVRACKATLRWAGARPALAWVCAGKRAEGARNYLGLCLIALHRRCGGLALLPADALAAPGQHAHALKSHRVRRPPSVRRLQSRCAGQPNSPATEMEAPRQKNLTKRKTVLHG